MRLFFALPLPPQALEEMERLQKGLPGPARLPRRESLHLTLAFLGETDPARLPAARRALFALEPPALDLTFSRLGSFPQKGGFLWWLVADPCPELAALEKELRSLLEKEGFPLERRPFLPHVTLARRVPVPAPQGASLPRPIRARCDRVCLLRSHLGPGGSRYEELICQPAKNPLSRFPG